MYISKYLEKQALLTINNMVGKTAKIKGAKGFFVTKDDHTPDEAFAVGTIKHEGQIYIVYTFG